MGDSRLDRLVDEARDKRYSVEDVQKRTGSVGHDVHVESASHDEEKAAIEQVKAQATNPGQQEHLKA